MNLDLALKEGPDDKAIEVYGRADYRGAEGAGAGDQDGGFVPQARDQTFNNWKSKYGGTEVAEARKLKQLLADAMLDNAALKDLLSKNGGPTIAWMNSCHRLGLQLASQSNWPREAKPTSTPPRKGCR